MTTRKISLLPRKDEMGWYWSPDWWITRKRRLSNGQVLVLEAAWRALPKRGYPIVRVSLLARKPFQWVPLRDWGTSLGPGGLEAWVVALEELPELIWQLQQIHPAFELTIEGQTGKLERIYRARLERLGFRWDSYDQVMYAFY